MTLHLIDVASWQTTEKRPSDPLDLAKAKAAGFSLVNIKTSQGDWYGYRSWMRAYADRARQLGMGICTFHWLDNTASGAAQAAIAYQRMRDIGGPDGMAHQCDCEDTTGNPATFTIWRDYVNAMQDKLGRPVVNYTGDWWWKPKGWTGAPVTPYLWAAPNAGYLSTYPGDTSSHWVAGYGGWKNYSILQYTVSPIAGAGGGNLSKSAIRDHAVWAALTGGDDMLKDERDALFAILSAVKYTDGRVEAMAAGRDEVVDNPAFRGVGEPVWLVQTVRQLVVDVAALKARPAADVDEAALAALLAPLLQPGVTLEQLRAVLASVRLTPGA